MIEKGVGLGLMLYCAAALASARMAYEARKERHYRSAIVSPIDPQERSKAADSFWTAQVNRGIAKSRCYEYTGVAIAPPLCYNQIDTATVIRSPMCLDAPREVTTEAKAQVDRTPPVCSSDIDFSPRAVTSRTVPDPRVEKFVKSICKGKRSFRPIRFPQMAANPTAWEDIFGSLAIPTADPIE